MDIIIKKPSECSGIELENITKVVLEGKQVMGRGIEQRIFACKLIGLCYVDNKLVGVSAIKNPAKIYVRNVLIKAKISDQAQPQFELGYSSTLEDHRGQGINKKINNALLESWSKVKLFATTDNNSMKNYLERKRFKKKGKSFKGNYNENLRYYEIY